MFFFFKQKTAYEMRISDWSSDVCSSDLIGKLPDPTTAAALQRVPGVQVSTNRNNELGDVRVRGLPDVLTTVNGREVFTTTGRSFDLQDMPAEALSRVNVYKSQTADITEGRSEEHTSELQSLMRISYAVFCLK